MFRLPEPNGGGRDMLAGLSHGRDPNQRRESPSSRRDYATTSLQYGHVSRGNLGESHWREKSRPCDNQSIADIIAKYRPSVKRTNAEDLVRGERGQVKALKDQPVRLEPSMSVKSERSTLPDSPSPTATSKHFDAVPNDSATKKLVPQSPGLTLQSLTETSVSVDGPASSSAGAVASGEGVLKEPPIAAPPRESAYSMTPVKSRSSPDSSLLGDECSRQCLSLHQSAVSILEEAISPSPDASNRETKVLEDPDLIESKLRGLTIYDSDTENFDDTLSSVSDACTDAASVLDAWPSKRSLSASSPGRPLDAGLWDSDDHSPAYSPALQQVRTRSSSVEDKQRNPKRRRTTGGSRRQAMTDLPLACPFAKKYPRHQWPNVCQTGFSSVSRIKEHIYRRHMLPVHCKRCFQEFETEAELDDHHQRGTPCSRRDRPLSILGGITAETKNRVKSRKGIQNKSEPLKWDGLYQILFPGDPVPKSPYVDRPPDKRAERDLSHFQEISRRMIKEKIGMIPDLADDMSLRILEAVDDVFDSIEPPSPARSRKRRPNGDESTNDPAHKRCPIEDQRDNVNTVLPAETGHEADSLKQVSVEDDLSWLDNIDVDNFFHDTINDGNFMPIDHELAVFLK